MEKLDRPPRVSVIVTTYNKERELALVLEGFRQQSFGDFELIVADDGSGEATRRVVEQARSRAFVPIVHSWQEDKGFRAARSRNQAISRACGELVVMTDGDCVPSPDYLAVQVLAFRDSHYLAGERYLTSQEEAERFDLEALESGSWLELVPRKQLRRLRVLRVKNWFYRRLRLKERPHVMTCNLMVSREDLVRINGFDERFVGWGHEDTDVGRRLRASGVAPANALAPGRLVHLWHKTESSFNSRVRDCENADYFHRGFFLSRCREGLVSRSYEDIAIALAADDPGQAREGRAALATEAAIEGRSSPEVEILVPARASSLSFQDGVDVPVLLMGEGAQASPSLLRRARLILTSEERAREFSSSGGKVEAVLPGGLLAEAHWRAARSYLDEAL